MTKKIASDDGSTGAKLAIFQDGKIHSTRVSNRATHGRAASFGAAADIYTCDLSTFTFDENADAIPTANIAYQYSPQASCAIQHALIKSGYAEPGEEIDLVVTLPLSEFFDADNRPDTKKIEAKKAMAKRKVTPEKFEAVKIKNVSVMPEGIPAALNSLRDENGQAKYPEIDLVLIADIGGTTLDLCLMRGIATSIVKVGSYPTGMVEVHKIRQKLLGYDTLPPAHTDRALRGLDECTEVEKAVTMVLNKALGEINDFIGSAPVNHIVCVGAGGARLAEMLRCVSDIAYPRIKTITAPDNAEFALAEAIIQIEVDNA